MSVFLFFNSVYGTELISFDQGDRRSVKGYLKTRNE